MVGAGRETTESRRLGSGSSVGSPREFVEDWADGSVRDSFFMFLDDRDLLGEGRINDSVSEVAEERAEIGPEPSPCTSAMSWFWEGVSMRREVGRPLRRCVAAWRAECGRGVAASMLLG